MDNPVYRFGKTTGRFLSVGANNLFVLGFFLKDFVSGLITSDLFCFPGVDVVMDAETFSVADESLRGIVMVDVPHHLCQPRPSP
jgi:hypothetical protein